MISCPECDAVLDFEESGLVEGDSLSCEECGASLVVVATDPEIEIEVEDDDLDDDEDFDEDLDDEEDEDDDDEDSDDEADEDL